MQEHHVNFQSILKDITSHMGKFSSILMHLMCADIRKMHVFCFLNWIQIQNNLTSKRRTKVYAENIV